MVHQERKEKKPYTQEIWTPGSFGTNKGALLLIFYMFIFLNIQFLNVFTEPAMHLLGEHSICAWKGRGEGRGDKTKPKTKEKFLGRFFFFFSFFLFFFFLSVSYNAGFFSTWPSEPERRHLQLPSEQKWQTHRSHRAEAALRTAGVGSVCVLGWDGVG